MTPSRPAAVSAAQRPGRLSGALTVGIGHALAAAAATGGFYWLLDSVHRTGGGPVSTLLLQASGFVALIWAYAGLVLGLVISIRQPYHRSGRRRRMAWRPAALVWHR